MGKAAEAYTKVPNWILDDTSLSTYEFRVLMHVVRQTIGYGKKSDGISISQFVKATGIGKTKISETLTALEKKGYIDVKRQTSKAGGRSYNRYSLPPYPPHGERYPPHGEDLTRDADIQKKIEQKKREKESLFQEVSEEEKRAFISYLTKINKPEKPKDYERKMRKQLNRQDKETMEIYRNWKEEREREEALPMLRRKYINANVIAGDTVGRISSIKANDKGYVITVIDIDGIPKDFRAETPECIERIVNAYEKHEASHTEGAG